MKKSGNQKCSTTVHNDSVPTEGLNDQHRVLQGTSLPKEANDLFDEGVGPPHNKHYHCCTTMRSLTPSYPTIPSWCIHNCPTPPGAPEGV